MYEYQAHIKDIIDGDTLDLDIDLGMETHRTCRVRLAGINTDKISTENGRKARDFVMTWCGNNSLIVRTIKDRKEKYGRYLVLVYKDIAAKNLNEALIEAGLARVYNGEKKDD